MKLISFEYAGQPAWGVLRDAEVVPLTRYWPDLATALAAVSYTHLDVYKRQVRVLARRLVAPRPIGRQAGRNGGEGFGLGRQGPGKNLHAIAPF